MVSVGMVPTAVVPGTSLSWSRSQHAGNPGAILKAGNSAIPARSPAALAARAEAGPSTTQPSPATSGATNGKPASASASSGSSSALVATRKSRAAEALEKAKQEIPPFAPADIYVVEFKPRNVLRNLSPAELYEQAIAHEEGNFIVSSGALATLSGRKTGRSPKDKRVVKEKAHADDVWWGKGSPNMEMDEYTFMMNREQAIDYLNTLDKVYVQDMFIGADPQLRLRVRIVCARAYHALFMHNMCIRPTDEELANFGEPDFTIYNAGHLPANRLAPYMTSATSIDIDLNRMEMVILGTEYAGEMKKGLFSLMNYLMPKQGNLSLHSGANMGMEKGDVSLFFGLSGTGKTTLSTDPNRYLIGDDEHIWSENGISNIEGGCYAKCINLSKENEPDIYNAIRFGSVLENVVFDPHTRVVDFADDSITENTRVSYPVDYIPNALIPGVAGHPSNIILLTCDAFGVLPPVSRLTVEQTMYHFISGYTAKVAGTEEGVTEPEATFSACFGAAFMVWHPYKYASLLAEKMQRYGATAWLVNTGWTAGGYGVGHRMRIKDTRAIIDAIHDGSLTADGVEYVKTPVFGLQVPTTCAGVAPEVLQPEMQWEDKEAYRNTLEKLGKLFQKNFSKFMEFEMGGETYDMPEAVVEAGPRL